jgi:hypothetical protein
MNSDSSDPDPVVDSSSDSDPDPDPDPVIVPDPVEASYVPLMVFEAYADFSGLGQDGVFVSDGDDPFIEILLINPVDAATLESIDTAVVSDYEVTVDDIEISDVESFPALQKVTGISTYLQTALVFDVSGSTLDVDIDALVAEAKNYIAAAKASTDPLIASQLYTVWAFGTITEELTAGFTDDTAALETALDLVATRYNSGALGLTSNLHRAVVEAIGRYNDGATYDFGGDGFNDLVDLTTRDFVNLSQLVMFSSGGDTYLEMDQELMTQAVQSQSFISYDSESTESDGSVSLYKPLFYYVVGGTGNGDTYAALSELAEETDQLLLSAGAYSFASDLVQNQIDAIERRIDLDNAHIYSFAFAPRIGDHTRVFTSRTENFNYSLTRSYAADGFVGDGSPGTPAQELASLVEITGPNGEYLAAMTASLSEVSTFAPLTRWVNTPYAAGDYAWTLVGGVGVNNADGTYSVSSITGPTATLTLNNILLGHAAAITITN